MMRVAGPSSRLRTLFLVVAVILSGSGCGGDSDEKVGKPVSRALGNFGADGIAAAEVVIQAYKDGRLGALAELEADMEPFFKSPDDGLTPATPVPFDASGQFLSLDEMSDSQARYFNLWSTDSVKVNSVVGAEKRAAVAKVLGGDN